MHHARYRFVINMLRQVPPAHFHTASWSEMGDNDGTTVPTGNLPTPVRSVMQHTCGGTACIGGYLVSTPEWTQDGGSYDEELCPLFEGNEGTNAIIIWLTEMESLPYDLVAAVRALIADDLPLGLNTVLSRNPQRCADYLEDLWAEYHSGETT